MQHNIFISSSDKNILKISCNLHIDLQIIYLDYGMLTIRQVIRSLSM